MRATLKEKFPEIALFILVLPFFAYYMFQPEIRMYKMLADTLPADVSPCRDVPATLSKPVNLWTQLYIKFMVEPACHKPKIMS